MYGSVFIGYYVGGQSCVTMEYEKKKLETSIFLGRFCSRHDFILFQQGHFGGLGYFTVLAENFVNTHGTRLGTQGHQVDTFNLASLLVDDQLDVFLVILKMISRRRQGGKELGVWSKRRTGMSTRQVNAVNVNNALIAGWFHNVREFPFHIRETSVHVLAKVQKGLDGEAYTSQKGD